MAKLACEVMIAVEGSPIPGTEPDWVGSNWTPDTMRHTFKHVPEECFRTLPDGRLAVFAKVDVEEALLRSSRGFSMGSN